jgi:hypothetical protein
VVTLLGRPAVLVGGIYLAGLPTYYALFTVGDTGTSASADRKPSLALFIIWIVIAVTVGYLTLLKTPRSSPSCGARSENCSATARTTPFFTRSKCC